jgi:alpha-glucosidase (family GH31 glycosyl hydrolase)
MVYSLAHHARDVGAPLVRPLMYEFPAQPAVAHVSDEFTLGASLLAAPVLVQNATTRTVVLPANVPRSNRHVLPDDAEKKNDGGWFGFNTTTHHAGGQNLTLTGLTLSDFPLFVRAGAILPLAPVTPPTEHNAKVSWCC